MEAGAKRSRFKSSDLNGHKLVWNFYDGRYEDGGKSYTAHTIVGVTPKFVYISKKASDLRCLGAERYERNKYYQLDRKMLESGKEVRHYGSMKTFVLEPDLSEDGWEWQRGARGCGYWRLSSWMYRSERVMAGEKPADMKKDMADLRKIMQQEHPDKGGDSDKFMAARSLYDSLRKHSKAA